MKKVDVANFVIIFACGVVGGMFLQSFLTPTVASEDNPNQIHQTDLTYYVANDTSSIYGPRYMQIGNEQITVTFKACRDYEYVNDEPHPCEPWRADE